MPAPVEPEYVPAEQSVQEEAPAGTDITNWVQVTQVIAYVHQSARLTTRWI